MTLQVALPPVRLGQASQDPPQWSIESLVTHEASHTCMFDGQAQLPSTQLPPLGQSCALQHALLAMHESPQAFLPAPQAQACATQAVPVGHSLSAQQASAAMQSAPHVR